MPKKQKKMNTYILNISTCTAEAFNSEQKRMGERKKNKKNFGRRTHNYILI